MLSWLIPHTQVVLTMHHDGDTRFALAYGEPGHILTAHVFWLGEIGDIQLYPNGYVHGSGYVYFWEPVNKDAQIQMHLTYDCMDWQKLQHMTWSDRDDYRQQLKTQIKLIT